MLYAFGVGEAAISISGDPADEGTFVHTVRDVGAVSKALSALEAGAVAGLRGPFGTGWPVAGAEGRDVVLVAGGPWPGAAAPGDLSHPGQPEPLWPGFHPVRLPQSRRHALTAMSWSNGASGSTWISW